MRLFSLFLALILSFLSEGTPCDSLSSQPWQDVCCEYVDDVEEEAVIRTETHSQKQIRVIPQSVSYGRSREYDCFTSALFNHLCLERQWLVCRRLRL